MKTVFLISDSQYVIEDTRVKRISNREWGFVQYITITEETLFQTEQGELTGMPGQILLSYWKGDNYYCVKDGSATIEEINMWMKSKDEEYEAKKKAKESTNENPQPTD